MDLVVIGITLQEKAMNKSNNGFETEIKIEQFDTLNFCFRNEITIGITTILLTISHLLKNKKKYQI